MNGEERTAPVQKSVSDRTGSTVRLPAGRIRWSEHCEAWLGYRRAYPGSAAHQDAERIAERGGFGHHELLDYLGHEPRTFEARR